MMKHLYKLGALALSATLIASMLAGCASSETDPEESTTPNTTTQKDEAEGAYVLTDIDDLYLTLADVPADTVIATAGDMDITAADYLYAATYICDQMSYMYQQYYGVADLPWDEEYMEATTWKDYINENALTTAALYALLPKLAEDAGLTVTEEMKDAVAEEVATAAQEVPEGILTDVMFWQMGATEEIYTQIATLMYLYDEMVAYYVENGIDGYPTDEEVIAHGDAAEAALSPYSAKHILFKTVDDTGAALPQEEIDAQLAQAEDVLAQLNAVSGDAQIALFDSLMNELSEDGRNPETGDLYAPDGYETSAGQMVPEFEEGALALDDYGISGIVETTYGYHIIMRLPMDTTVDYEAYRAELVNEKIFEMQDELLANNLPVTNDAYKTVDVQTYYENLGVLYNQISAEITAAME